MNNKVFNNLPNDIQESDAPWSEVYREDFHVTVYNDKYAVTPGHKLFVPKYNTISVLMDAVEDAVRYGKSLVDNKECDGFNIGINFGEAAGQTISWPHVHLIPRRTGDVDDPTGGVRNIIPGKGNYKNEN